ncbi:Uncharacterised protein [uncultured Flavonifractor sp.]|nr:Uncharacterised protein [uncultured Flavonifractor sp.]
MTCGGETEQNLRLSFRRELCLVRVCVSGSCPWDSVTLQNWKGCFQSSRQLCACGQAFFTALPPGTYLLTLCRGRAGVRLLLCLPPGGQITLCHDPATGCCRWYRPPARSFPLCPP